LENSYSRRDEVLSKRYWERWDSVRWDWERWDSVKCIGEIAGKVPGREVYSAAGLACTQKATRWGPGWCTGVYEIEGKSSRLTVKESGKLQGFRGDFEFDED
jgi:hypothetical protein